MGKDSSSIGGKEPGRFVLYSEELTSIANVGKDMMLTQLVKEGFLTKEQAIIAKKRFFVILQKRHWLSSLFKEGDGYSYIMVKTDTDIETGSSLEFKPE